VDPNQDDKSKEIKLCSFARPHMRAFHCCWFAFFCAFFIWFAVAPLLGEIRGDLGLTKQQVWTSNIVGVGGTIFMRFLLGPACDKWGGRIPMAGILCIASIPTACVGFVNSANGLTIVRLFIGIAGGTFVMCQFWASRMFCKEVVGTANALAAGWGNLGGGVTQLVMGSILFPLFKAIYDGDSEKAWRTVCVVPAVCVFFTGVMVYLISDDCPKGNYSDLKKHGVMAEISAATSFRVAALNLNTWVMFIQYAACFGVELTMNNAASLYFIDVFDQTTEQAGAIASIFGWMNLFARGTGGFISDKMNASCGMRGRLWAQTICLAGEGVMVLIFANTKSLGLAIVIMTIFSLFVQAAEGTTFGIVPYIDPPATGSISGIVGAGGNVGAVSFGFGFRQLSYKSAFYIMGFTILGSCFTSLLVNIKGYSGLVWGEEVIPAKTPETLTVPQTDAEKAEKVAEE
jgi:MFS transporter, NNP family, nitrate/nitrite transporter